MGGVNISFNDVCLEVELTNDLVKEYVQILTSLPEFASRAMVELTYVKQSEKRMLFVNDGYEGCSLDTMDSRDNEKTKLILAFLNSNCPWDISDDVLPRKFYGALFKIYGAQIFNVELENQSDGLLNLYSVELRRSGLRWNIEESNEDEDDEDGEL